MSDHPLRLRLVNIMRRALLGVVRATRGIDPDKVVFSCFAGRAYGDNPRAISERLHARCPGAKIVWVFKRAAFRTFRARFPST